MRALACNRYFIGSKCILFFCCLYGRACRFWEAMLDAGLLSIFLQITQATLASHSTMSNFLCIAKFRWPKPFFFLFRCQRHCDRRYGFGIWMSVASVASLQLQWLLRHQHRGGFVHPFQHEEMYIIRCPIGNSPLQPVSVFCARNEPGNHIDTTVTCIRQVSKPLKDMLPFVILRFNTAPFPIHKCWDKTHAFLNPYCQTNTNIACLSVSI